MKKSMIYAAIFMILLSFAFATPKIGFDEPTPEDGFVTDNKSTQMNVSITESDLSELTWQWDKQNTTLYDDSLVLMMNFDNYTKLNDTSNYGNDGSNNGATWTANGRYGGAYEFDGGDYISTNTNINYQIRYGFTLSSWVYSGNYSAAGSIIDNYDGGQSNLDYKDGISFVLRNNRIRITLVEDSGGNFIERESNAVLEDGSWHHVAAAWNGGFSCSDFSLYIDGKEETSSCTKEGTVDSLDAPARKLEMGRALYTTGYQFYLNALLDEVRIYNRALSEQEVKQLYMSNLRKYDTDKWQLYVNESNLTNGTYTYQTFANDGAGNKNKTEKRELTIGTMPLSSNFQTFPSTTNFSAVEDLSNVENLTLGSPHGTISFGNNTVNAEGQNYDKNIVFGDCFVAVNASDLDYTFNATAYLLMNNSDGHCGDDTIFVTSQIVADAGAVKTGAKICTDCKTISVGGDSVTFKVPHFSSYAIGSNSNITIDADDPQLVNKTVTFTAVYRNSSSGEFISGANCQIELPTGSHTMNEGTEQYIYQTSFEQNATYEYNVTCSKTGYNTLLVDDSFQILPAGEAVPEFSIIAVLLLLIAAALIVAKRKKF